MKQLIYMFALLSTLLLVSCTDAGEDQEALAGTKVTLNGSDTKTDMGGTITQYDWTQVSQEGVATLHIYDRDSAIASFIAPSVTEETDIKFKLTTTESYNCESDDDSSCRHHISSSNITVTVLPSDINTTLVYDDIEDNGIYSVAVSGSIMNTSGSLISNVIVSANGKETATRTDGRYSIINIETNQRVVINVSHPDYFEHSRIILANLSNVFEQNFKLYAPTQTVTFDPKDGAAISDNGATLIFPADTKFLDEGMKTYSGDVTVQIRYSLLDQDAFPGGYEGSNGTESFPLLPHGFVYAKIKDTSGNKLYLASESSATLKLPVTDVLSSTQTVSTWIYDYKTGYWLEDATAVSENGTFDATIKQIGTYGILTRAPGAILTTCVEDINGLGVSGANIQITATNWKSNLAQTDSEGHITLGNILAREEIQIEATKSPRDPGVQSVILNEGETRSLLDNCIVLSTAEERAEAEEKVEVEVEETTTETVTDSDDENTTEMDDADAAVDAVSTEESR